MMTVTLWRISIVSAFRVGFIVGGLLFALFGLIGLVLQVTLFETAVRSGFFASSDGPFTLGISSAFASIANLGTLCCFYFVGIVASAFAGGIGGAATAGCYNLAARWVGGLRFDFDEDGRETFDMLRAELWERKQKED